MRISVKDLHERICTMMMNEGALPSRAQAVADEIVYAEACGIKSHGLPMLPVVLRRAGNASEPTVESRLPTVAVVAGNGAPGPYASKIAMDEAISRAERLGLGMAALVNVSTFLATGYGPWRAAREHGLVGVCCSAADAKVAPFGSIDPIFGTNPLAVAFPTAGEPLVVDLAITNMPAAEVRHAAAVSEALPPGVAIDHAGAPTTDASMALEGAMLPFGGYKGSAIAFIVECLSGAMIPGAKAGNFAADRGMLFIALQPAALGDPADLADRVEQVAWDISASRPAKADIPPRAPGVNSRADWQAAQNDGIVLQADGAKLLGLA